MFATHRIAFEHHRRLWMTVGLFIAGTAFADAQGTSNGLPPQASPVAQSIVEGELEVQIEDSDAGSRTHHFVHAGGRRIRLEMTGDGPGWETGTIVRARGRFRDAETLELGPGGSGLEPMALANSNTFGEQRTLVILVNFAGSEQQPYSSAHASTVTFGETKNFFLENSHGQTWLAGDVAGWFTINVSTSTCDSNGIANAADQAATAAGYNLSQYKRKVYAFPRISACSWWGLGSVGGNPSRAWVNGTYSLKVVAHEFGHNFGDYHSRSQACTSTGCSVSEYGDDADVMGNPTSGHMNAFQKERLGWLNYGDAPAIQAVGATGNYWIDSYAVNDPASGAPKALKILKSVDGGGKRTWLYVEARTQAGFDNGVAPGVILHSGYEGNGREVYQLDIDPVTSTKDWRLNPGQTFTDAAIGVHVTTLWADATGAMIDVVFESNPCTTSAPTLTASPAGSVTTAAGTPVTYTVNLTNNDASECGAATFDLETWVPAGWTGSASPASLSIASGSTGSAVVTVTPPATATTGADVQIGAYRSGGSGATLVRTIQIEASSSCSASAPTITTNPGGTVSTPAGASVSYQVTVRNNDTACTGSTFGLSASVPAGWLATVSPSSLTLSGGSEGTATVTLTPPATISGSHTISIATTRPTGPGASVTRTVDVTPVVTGPLDLDVSVSEAKGGYVFEAMVRAGGNPLAGALVTFTISSGTTVVSTVTTVTDDAGRATAVYRAGGGKNARKGLHTVFVEATAGGQTVTGSVEFGVR